MLLGGAIEACEFASGFVDFFSDRLKALGFGGAKLDEFFFKFLAIVFPSVIELSVEFGDFLLKPVRKLLGVLEILVRQFGEFVEAVGGDANLFGGGVDRPGKRLEPALAFIERLVLLARIVGEKWDRAEQRAHGDAGGDGGECFRVEWTGGAIGDEPGGGEKDDVAEKERKFGEFWSLIG